MKSLVKEVIGKIGSAIKNTLNGGEDDTDVLSEVVFKEESIRMVKNEFERRRQEKLPNELQWQLNVNFLSGNQYCDINLETSSVLEIPKLYWYQEREVYNQIAAIVETRLSKLGRVDPSLKTRPATNERQDISSAKVCTAYLKGNYRRLEMLQKIKQGNAWAEIIGTVFHKNIWDGDTGKVVANLNGSEVKEGDLKTIVCPAYEIYPDSIYSSTVDDCRSIMHVKAYHVDEIELIWGITLKGRDVDVFNLSQTNIGTGGLGYTANVQKVSPTKLANHELVMEYYERPSKKHPNGQLIIVAGNELLHYGELPYKIGEDGERDLPFVRQVCVERPGYFFGISIVERLIPLQRSYNAIMNRINEYLNRCVMGVLTYEDGSVDIEDIRENGIAPGSDIPYMKGAMPPKFMENGSLPTEFTTQLTKLENLFVVISGVSTFARDSAPPVGANSGVAMEIVKEQDDTRLSLTAESIRLAVIKDGQQWIRLGKQYSKMPRMMKYVGKNNDVMVLEWQASDLTTDDVILESENELSQTPAQRKQTVVDMLGQGLFNDPDTGKISRHDKVKIFELLEMGNWESGDDLDELHVTRAQRENLYLEKGMAPAIFKYDDDDLHIQEHLRYVLTSEFEELTKNSPELANLMVSHIMQHEQSVSAKLAVQMQKAQMMNPQPAMQ